jgi:hypothetical protein
VILVFISTTRTHCKLKKDELRTGREEERGKGDDDGSEEGEREYGRKR